MGELLDKQPILDLQSRKHRARWDISRFDDELPYSEIEREREENRTPEIPERVKS